VSDAAQWLEWLFGQKPPGLIWVGGHGDEFKGRTFSEPGGAAEYASWLDDGAAGGVYFRLTLMNAVAEGRGKAGDSSHLVAFGADLDLAGPGHKEAKLPRPGSEGELRSILTAAGAPEPTAWVHSGGGRYAFWKLGEPIALESETLRSEAAGVSSALHANIIAEAAVRGLKIDNTRDLARIYRLPGTHNRKGDIPFVAKVLTSDGPRHSLDGMRSGARPRESALAAAPSRTSSVLFGGGDRAGDRSFTDAEAREFIETERVKLERDAEPGNYNNAINAFAKVISHFALFCSQEFAQALIFETLKDKTGWAGLDEDDLTTITSAYRSAAGDWQAQRVPTIEEVAEAATEPDAVDAMLARLLTRDQLDDLPEARPLVAGLLDMDSESWIIGEPGGFKSFAALDIACHVACGMSWQERQVTVGEVIYIVAEGSKGIRKRVQAWEATYGRRVGNMLVLPEPIQVAPDGPRGGIGKDWLTLVEVVRRRKPVLVVIDTQARVTVGLKENDNSEMGVLVLAVTRMKQAAGSCVLVVHHTGRDGGDARGASAIDGAQDTELKVVRPARGSKNGREERAKLTAVIYQDKQKDSDDSGSLEIGLTEVTVGVSSYTGEPITSLALMPRDVWREQQIKNGGVASEDGSAARLVSEPGEWTKKFDRTGNDLVRRILQTVYELGGEFGRAEGDFKRAVIEKWYKKGEGRGAGQLRTDSSTAGWVRAWNLCREAQMDGAEPEPVVTNLKGGKFALNPLLLAVTDE
jgi:hypothetical protein